MFYNIELRELLAIKIKEIFALVRFAKKYLITVRAGLKLETYSVLKESKGIASELLKRQEEFQKAQIVIRPYIKILI